MMCEAIHGAGRRGQAWSYHQQFTTYRPSSRCLIYSLHRLPHSSPVEFQAVLDEIREAGLSPPSSYPSLCDALWRPPRPNLSVLAPFRDQSVGNWEQSRLFGQLEGTWTYYDLRQAYRWAAGLGLPDLRTATRSVSFLDAPAVWLVELEGLCVPYHRQTQVMLSSEERTALGVLGGRILAGWKFAEWWTLEPIFDWLQKHCPSSLKRVIHSFAGRYNTEACAYQHGWGGGGAPEKVRELPNPFYNPIWAHLIYTRVKLRLAEHWEEAALVFADAILTQASLPLGDRPGDWQIKGRYVSPWVRSAGVWGTAEGMVKRAGLGPGRRTDACVSGGLPGA